VVTGPLQHTYRYVFYWLISAGCTVLHMALFPPQMNFPRPSVLELQAGPDFGACEVGLYRCMMSDVTDVAS